MGRLSLKRVCRLVPTCNVKWDYIQGDVTGGLWAQDKEDGPAIISSASCSGSRRGMSLYFAGVSR